MSDCLLWANTHTHTNTARYAAHKGHSLIYGSSDKGLSQTWASSTATGANTSSLSPKACISYGHGLLVAPITQSCGRAKSCLGQANMLMGCEGPPSWAYMSSEGWTHSLPNFAAFVYFN